MEFFGLIFASSIAGEEGFNLPHFILSLSCMYVAGLWENEFLNYFLLFNLQFLVFLSINTDVLCGNRYMFSEFPFHMSRVKKESSVYEINHNRCPCLFSC